MIDKIAAIIMGVCGLFFGFCFWKSGRDQKKRDKEELQKKQKVIDNLYEQSTIYKKYQEKMEDEKEKAHSHTADGFNASFDMLQKLSEDGKKRISKK